MAERSRQPLSWSAILFMLFVLLMLGGMVAIAYSPVVAGLFSRGQSDQPPEPAAPSDSIEGVPAPDNVQTRATEFPGPDNAVRAVPRSDADAPRSPSDQSDSPAPGSPPAPDSGSEGQ
ncbi:MAG: hypothetical protein SFZ24_11120 [Planctomycetota bacterium]|nr:hypothetical protein [Planctomycetota bacterium]